MMQQLVHISKNTNAIVISYYSECFANGVSFACQALLASITYRHPYWALDVGKNGYYERPYVYKLLPFSVPEIRGPI